MRFAENQQPIAKALVPRTLPMILHADGERDVGFRNIKLLGNPSNHPACYFDGRCRLFSTRKVVMTKVVAQLDAGERAVLLRYPRV